MGLIDWTPRSPTSRPPTDRRWRDLPDCCASRTVRRGFVGGPRGRQATIGPNGVTAHTERCLAWPARRGKSQGVWWAAAWRPAPTISGWMADSARRRGPRAIGISRRTGWSRGLCRGGGPALAPRTRAGLLGACRRTLQLVGAIARRLGVPVISEPLQRDGVPGKIAREQNGEGPGIQGNVLCR